MLVSSQAHLAVTQALKCLPHLPHLPHLRRIFISSARKKKPPAAEGFHQAPVHGYQKSAAAVAGGEAASPWKAFMSGWDMRLATITSADSTVSLTES